LSIPIACVAPPVTLSYFVQLNLSEFSGFSKDFVFGFPLRLKHNAATVALNQNIKRVLSQNSERIKREGKEKKWI